MPTTTGAPVLSGAAPRRVAAILNPVAGGKRRPLVAAVLGEMKARGQDLALRETTCPGDAEALARAACDGETDLLVVAGGDGTINEAVNGLMAAPAARRPALGLVPIGTANVLAQEIGLARAMRGPRAAHANAETLIEGPLKAVTVARAVMDGGQQRHFLLMAGVGFDAQVVCEVDLALKRRFGKGAYVWESLRQLWRFGFPRYRVTIEGAGHEVGQVIVANAKSYGGPYVAAPKARLESPDFQVCLFHRGGRLAAALAGAALPLNRLPDLPGVAIVTADKLRIEGDPGAPVQGDGDIIARLPVTIEALPEALRLVYPA